MWSQQIFQGRLQEWRDGDQLFAVFSHAKPNYPVEMNPKETSKWEMEQKLDRAALIQDELLFTAVSFWKSLSHKLQEARKIFSGSTSICCLIPPSRYSVLVTVRGGIVDLSSDTICLLLYEYHQIQPCACCGYVWSTKRVFFQFGDNVLERFKNGWSIQGAHLKRL